jgi:hypothetical protein
MQVGLPETIKYMLFTGVLDKSFASNTAFYVPFCFWRTTANPSYDKLWFFCKSFIDERGDIVSDSGDSGGFRGQLGPQGAPGGSSVVAFGVGVPGTCQFCPRANHAAHACFHNPQSPAYNPSYARRPGPPTAGTLPRSPLLALPGTLPRSPLLSLPGGTPRLGQPTGRMIPADLAAQRQCFNCFGYGHTKIQCPSAARQSTASPGGMVAASPNGSPVGARSATSGGAAGNRFQPRGGGPSGSSTVRSNAVGVTEDVVNTDASGDINTGEIFEGTEERWLDGGQMFGYSLQPEFYGVESDE